MGKVVDIRPPMFKFTSWLNGEIRKLSRMRYEELLLLPEEIEIDGPYIHPDVKYFVRRQFMEKGEPGIPPGTVEVFVCVNVYEHGQFKMGSWPSVEMTPQGRILDPLRDWDPRD